MHVPFLDLRITNPDERRDLIAAYAQVLDHGRLVLGPEVAEFEARAAEFCGRKHGIGVGTGTDALILGLHALDIGPGDEVITTPLSWLATGSAILLNGATAVFCDIDDNLNMDPQTIEPLITERTKAILPVHFTGHQANMEEIGRIATAHGLHVIEDGAQAFGAEGNHRPTGGHGILACISLNVMKVLAGTGDAGIIVTDDDGLSTRLRALRHTGVPDRELCMELSHNCRLDTVQAAALLVRLKYFPDLLAKRRHFAGRYDNAFADLAPQILTPPRPANYADVHYTYVVRTPRREALREFLAERQIETKIQHPILMNDQPAFQGRIRGTSPRAHHLVEQILALPVHEKMTDNQQDWVISSVRAFFSGRD